MSRCFWVALFYHCYAPSLAPSKVGTRTPTQQTCSASQKPLTFSHTHQRARAFGEARGAHRECWAKDADRRSKSRSCENYCDATSTSDGGTQLAAPCAAIKVALGGGHPLAHVVAGKHSPTSFSEMTPANVPGFTNVPGVPSSRGRVDVPRLRVRPQALPQARSAVNLPCSHR